MNLYLVLTTLICLSAGFAYLNQKFLKLPFVIGLFLLSTGLSVIVISFPLWLNLPLKEIKTYIELAEIDKIVLRYLLGFLLFSGALQTNWNNLKQQLRPIATFAIGGVFLSTIIIAVLFYGLTQTFGLPISFIYCLIFGALISPTDPVAVLGILAKANVPKKTEYTIVGESLFNDGTGIVIFIAMLDTLNTGEFNLAQFGLLFIKEAAGGDFNGPCFGLYPPLTHKIN